MEIRTVSLYTYNLISLSGFGSLSSDHSFIGKNIHVFFFIFVVLCSRVYIIVMTHGTFKLTLKITNRYIIYITVIIKHTSC